jgi:hypothetical protein
LPVAQLGFCCWNGFDSQKWEICFHRLAILLTFRQSVDTLCVCGANDTQTGDDENEQPEIAGTMRLGQWDQW